MCGLQMRGFSVALFQSWCWIVCWQNFVSMTICVSLLFSVDFLSPFLVECITFA